MVQSVRGVYKDIKDSTYNYLVGGLDFYFSSLNKKYRFIRKMSGLYDILDVMEEYEKIQKTQFRVHYKGVDHLCLETIISVLDKKTLKDLANFHSQPNEKVTG